MNTQILPTARDPAHFYSNLLKLYSGLYFTNTQAKKSAETPRTRLDVWQIMAHTTYAIRERPGRPKKDLEMTLVTFASEPARRVKIEGAAFDLFEVFEGGRSVGLWPVSPRAGAAGRAALADELSSWGAADRADAWAALVAGAAGDWDLWLDLIP